MGCNLYLMDDFVRKQDFGYFIGIFGNSKVNGKVDFGVKIIKSILKKFGIIYILLCLIIEICVYKEWQLVCIMFDKFRNWYIFFYNIWFIIVQYYILESEKKEL